MTREEVLKELNRELSMRKTMYPKWISAGTLNKDRARLQYSRLQDAIKVIERLNDAEFTQIKSRMLDTERQMNLF